MTRVGTIQCDGECGRIVGAEMASRERWFVVRVNRRPVKRHASALHALDFCSQKCAQSMAGLEMYARTMDGRKRGRAL